MSFRFHASKMFRTGIVLSATSYPSDQHCHVPDCLYPCSSDDTNAEWPGVGTVYKSSKLDVPAETPWRFVERYPRSDVHMFASLASSERQEGEYRVVTQHGGAEVWEPNVGVAPERMRATYTIPRI